MGISDLKVPKEMQRMGRAFYGRSQAYLAALGDDRALVETLTRNIYGGAPSAAAAPRLAAYTLEAAGELKAQEPAPLAAGILRFPDPAAIVANAKVGV
jgi:cytochrome b pre-mRNA-processing protein 3